VTGSILVAETMHAIRMIGLGLGMKEPKLEDVVPPVVEG